MDNLNKFREALAFTLPHEGNTTTDDGGLTKWGISQAEYPEEDIANLTPSRALFLYKRDYWDKIGGDQLDFPYCVTCFDTAVNCGVQRTLFWMRLADDAWSRLLHFRTTYYDSLNHFPKYRQYYRGWMNRVADLKKYCEVKDSSTTYGV